MRTIDVLFNTIIVLKPFSPMKSAFSPVECDLVVGLFPGGRHCGDGVNRAGIGGNRGGGSGTGKFWGSGSNRESGGGEGISTVDASITWAKTPPTTDLPASVNGESGRPGISAIDWATTTLDALSFKGSGAGASKTWTKTWSVTVVSPVVVMVAAAALSPPSPPEKSEEVPDCGAWHSSCWWWPPSCLLHQGRILRQQKSCAYLIQTPPAQFPPQGQCQREFWFFFHSVAPRALSQWSDMYSVGLYLGSNGTAWIGGRHHDRLFVSFSSFFKLNFDISMHLHSQNWHLIIEWHG